MSDNEKSDTANNESFYKSLFKNNKGIMLLINPKTSQIEDCNLSACHFYGYSYDEMLKLKITNFNVLTEEQIVKEMNLAKNENRNTFYFKHRLSDGQVRDVEVFSTPINLEGKDLLFSIISDTTKSKIYSKILKDKNDLLERTVADRTYELEEINAILNKANNMLRIEHERVTNIIEGTNAGTWEWNVQTGETVINKRWAEIIGYTIEELSPLSNDAREKFINTEDLEEYYKQLNRVFAKEIDYYDVEFRKKHKDGSWVWVNDRAKVISWTPDQKPFLMSGTNTDITERKRSEYALKESEEKYRLLITQMQQGLAVHEVILDKTGKVVDYRFLDVNKSFESLTGLKHENVIGKTVMELLPETESYWIEKYAHVALTGELLHYENYSKELDKYYEVVAYSPRYKQFATIISDVTERKKAEISLAQEKKLLQTTLISIGDGVISTDINGNIVLLNKVAESLTGWTIKEARGKSIEEAFNIINEFTRKKSENIVKKVLESGKVQELANHTILVSKYGVERPIEDSAAPIVNENDEISGMVLVFRDVTQKKQKQEEILFLSYHDQLTGLYNRRFYQEELKRLDTKRNLPITIVMGDVNGLKLINDSFGHDTGDELLKKVAKVIRKGCRSDDIIARLGGDEFIIILPKTDAFEAEQLITRINKLTLKEKIGSLDISISFGYETKYKAGEKIQDIFKNAEDRMYKKKLFESPSMRGKTINTIMSTLHEKNKREEQHSNRVSALCKSMGEALGMTEHEIDEIRTVGLLHDIGKIAINENVLNKPGKLTDDEWKEIRRHPEIGYRILSTVNDMAEMAEYALYHHERWDGKGYPKGLKGKQIPFVSRIITISDAYDAMTSERSYRSALPEDVVINELQKNAGIQFDPELVSVFIEKLLKINKD